MNSSLVRGVVAGAGLMGLPAGATAAGVRGLDSDSDFKRSFAGVSVLGGPIVGAGMALAAIAAQAETPHAAQILKGNRIGMAGIAAAALGAGVIYAAS